MLEAATEHMGARQQAYSDHHLFQHFAFTLTQNFLFTAM